MNENMSTFLRFGIVIIYTNVNNIDKKSLQLLGHMSGPYMKNIFSHFRYKTLISYCWSDPYMKGRFSSFAIYVKTIIERYVLPH